MTLPYYVPPEQLMKDRAEFALKGVARGRPIVAVDYTDGLLLMGENSSGALYKISEIYDRIGFAGVGKFNEFEALRVGGIRLADAKGYNYGRSDVAAKALANAYSQTLGQIFTHEVKPYEVEVLVAEVGETAADDKLFRVTYDGTLYDETHFSAIGGNKDALLEKLGERHTEGLDLAGAIAVASAAIEEVEEDERSIQPDEWEAATLDRGLGRRRFRRLTTNEIAAARG